jgi:hypothetical protein
MEGKEKKVGLADIDRGRELESDSNWRNPAGKAKELFGQRHKFGQGNQTSTGSIISFS